MDPDEDEFQYCVKYVYGKIKFFRSGYRIRRCRDSRDTAILESFFVSDGDKKGFRGTMDKDTLSDMDVSKGKCESGLDLTASGFDDDTSECKPLHVSV